MNNDLFLNTMLISLIAITVLNSLVMFGIFVFIVSLSKQNRKFESIIIESMKKKDEKSFKEELNQLEAKCILEDLEKKINHYNS